MMIIIHTIIIIIISKVALQTARGLYAGGNGETLDAFAKKLDADRLWTFQLAVHPQ